MHCVSRASSRKSRQDRTLTSRSSSNFVTMSHKLRLSNRKRSHPRNHRERKPRRNTNNKILMNPLGTGIWCVQAGPTSFIPYTRLDPRFLSRIIPYTVPYCHRTLRPAQKPTRKDMWRPTSVALQTQWSVLSKLYMRFYSSRVETIPSLPQHHPPLWVVYHRKCLHNNLQHTPLQPCQHHQRQWEDDTKI